MAIIHNNSISKQMVDRQGLINRIKLSNVSGSSSQSMLNRFCHPQKPISRTILCQNWISILYSGIVRAYTSGFPAFWGISSP